MLYGGVTLPGRPDPDNIAILDRLPVPQIRRMQRVGVAIDREWLANLSGELEARRQDLKKEITSYIPEESLERFGDEIGREGLDFNPGSSAQLATLLFDVLKIGRGRRLRRTKSGKRISAGKKQLESLKREHPVIPRMLEYTEITKLKGTFCDKLPKRAVLHNRGECGVCGLRHYEDHWRTHPTINTTRTVAGRLSMKNDNLQQIPSRTKSGREVRKGFVAQPGYKLVTRDYGQLHVRLVAHLAQEPKLRQMFVEGKDPHTETAKLAFRLPPGAEPDRLTQRDPCKSATFLIIYQGGGVTLYDTLVVVFSLAGVEVPSWLTVEWCDDLIERWYGVYPRVREYFEIQQWRARKYGITWCPFGRVRRVPEVRSCHERIRAAGLRQGGNHPILACEAGMVKEAQARVEDRLEEYRRGGVGVEAVIPVHDELVFEIHEEWAEEISEGVGWEMERALTDIETGECWSTVPITTEGKVTDRWQK